MHEFTYQPDALTNRTARLPKIPQPIYIKGIYYIIYPQIYVLKIKSNIKNYKAYLENLNDIRSWDRKNVQLIGVSN
jgi:hypothetical protein